MFKIERGMEYFLFMEMRATQKWVSFLLTKRSWVRITQEYNEALEKKNNELKLITIPKNPQALIEQLGQAENEILKRLANEDFVCEYCTDSDSFP